MAEQKETFTEKNKSIDIALKFTGRDLALAKDMAAGHYNDLVVVKGKFQFTEKQQAGLFIAFFNTHLEYISKVATVTIVSPVLFDKIRIFDDWKHLYEDIQLYKKDEAVIDSVGLADFLKDSFVGYDLFPAVREKNLEEITRTVSEILEKHSGTKPMVQIELSDTSSLGVELSGVKLDLPASEGKDDSSESGEIDPRAAKIEDESDFIVPAKLVLSPVHGKNVEDVKIGEKIKVVLTGSDPVTKKILTVLKAFDESGIPLPISGRLKEKIPLEKSGFTIYALVAKGIHAKIVEEEHVKIMLDTPEKREDSESASDRRLVFLIISGIIVFLVAGIIIIRLL